MLFGIDKWPSGDGRERDEARSDRDKRTNDCKSGFKYGIKQYKIKENAFFSSSNLFGCTYVIPYGFTRVATADYCLNERAAPAHLHGTFTRKARLHGCCNPFVWPTAHNVKGFQPSVTLRHVAYSMRCQFSASSFFY